MMEWLLFALLSPAFWGLNNVFYKFLMTKKFQGYYSMVIYLNFVDLIFAAFVYATTSISFQYPYAVLAMLVGMISPLAFWFYSKALMVEEISRITPLFQFIPIFVVLLSVVFLNEILSAQKYLGIALIVLTSLLISYRKSENGGSLSAAFRLMVPFAVIIAVYTVLNKYLLGYMDPWSVFFWMMIGSFLLVLVMMAFGKPREAFVQTAKDTGTKTFFVTVACEGLYVAGTICALLAMSTGYVSLVSTLAGLQNFFVFIFMLLLSLFVPNVLKEETTKSVVAIKSVAVALMFVGTWLLAL